MVTAFYAAVSIVPNDGEAGVEEVSSYLVESTCVWDSFDE